MTKVQNFLCGNYSQIGANLKKEDSSVHLIIRERKTITKFKPKKFLIRVDQPKPCYISSLYPIDNNIHSLDYNGIKYKLTQSTTAGIGQIGNLKANINLLNSNLDD